MKSKRVLLVGLPVVFAAILAVGLSGRIPAWGNPAGTPQADLAYRYYDHLKKGQWDEAYLLTSQAFRNKIPAIAFTSAMEAARMTETLVSYTPGGTVMESADADTAKVYVNVETTFIGPRGEAVSGPMPLMLVKEGTKWTVDPGWHDFLAFKLSTLTPLAFFDHKEVSMSVKSIVLYQPPDHDPLTYVRVEISNHSGRVLEWRRPNSAPAQGFIQDTTTGAKYLSLPGIGSMGKGTTFRPERDSTGVGITINPGDEGSIFFNFELVPEQMKEFTLVLDGFSFPDTGQRLEAVFEKVPFRFDVMPPKELLDHR